jgi:hypothetical protein
LYSDRILAIVRELACNAYDAHVAAGKADVPIEIKLPTYFDSSFYVKDFGTGLSPEEIAGHTDHNGVFTPGIYQTFFDSDKTDSNDFIGALGLGSKSPFSYTDNFTVESRFNGMVYYFLAFKNEEGLPSITEVSRQETSEPNGMTITLSVRNEDTTKFFSAAKTALMYFNPVPSIVGRQDFITPHHLEHTVLGTDWKLRKTGYEANMHGPRVVQGFVSYPISASILKGATETMSDTAQALVGVDLDLYVPIGQVDVAPSREALTYNKKTCANLVNALESAALEMRTRFQEAFDRCTTMWEMLVCFEQFTQSKSDKFNAVFKSMNNKIPFQWKGAAVDNNVRVCVSSFGQMTIQQVWKAARSSSRTKSMVSMGPLMCDTIYSTLECSINPSHDEVIIDRLGKRSLKAFSQTYLDTSSASMLIIIRPRPGQKYSQEETNALLGLLGHPPTKYVDEVAAVTPKAPSTYVKREKDVCLVWGGFTSKFDGKRTVTNRNYSRLTWYNDRIDLDEGGYYVRVERFTPTALPTLMDSFIKNAQELGYLPKDNLVVWGLTDKTIAEIQDDDNWVNIYAHCAMNFELDNEDNALVNQTEAPAILAELQERIYPLQVVNWLCGSHWTNTFCDMFEDGMFKKFCATINAYHTSFDTKKVQAITAFKYWFAPDSMAVSQASEVGKKMVDEWRQVNSHYPMLRLISWHNVDEDTMPVLVSYINEQELTKSK